MLELNVIRDAARSKASGNLLAAHQERPRAGDAADDVDVFDGAPHDAAVRIVKGDGSFGIASEGVNVERDVVVELAPTGAEHGALVREGGPGESGAGSNAEAGRKLLVLDAAAVIEGELGIDYPMILQ